MVWCGVVWCGVVWCGVVWCGVVWCGVVWCDMSVRVLMRWVTVICGRYVVQTASCPPTFLLFCTRAANLTPPRLREISNAMRERFGLQGVPINLVPKEG